MKYFSTKFNVLALGLFSLPVLSAQNEVSFGVADVQDIDDQFIGLSYTRYLQDVGSNGEPLMITSYLQKVDRISGRYFGVNDMDRYELGGQWFVGDDWQFSGNVRYIDTDRYYDNDYKSVDFRAGYFLSNQWQVGAGVLYEREEYDDRYTDGVRWIEETHSRTEFSPSIFTRYTQIDNGSGWDLSAQATFSEWDALELSASYFFTPRFSLYSTYTYRNDSNRYRDDTSTIEIGTDYWFTSRFSMRFGLGTDLSDENDLGSVTLLLNYRF